MCFTKYKISFNYVSYFSFRGKLFSTTMHSVKVVVVVFVFLIHFNHHNEGNCKETINVTELDTTTVSYEHQNEDELATSFVYRKEASNFPESESSSPTFTSVDLIIGTISITISNLFSLVILSYFGNLALSKDCLLLYLYKDLMTLVICLNCLAETSLVLAYTFGDGMGISVTGAKCLSFVACNILLLLLLFMNIISALKFYQKKANVLDPSMPWGDDDKKGIKWIRVVAATITLVLTSTMFGLGLYPTTYYWFSGQDIPSFTKESTTFIIYPLMLIFLISTSIIIALATKFYKLPIPHTTDSGIPHQIDYFHITFCIMLFIIVILGESNFLNSSNLWNLWKIHMAAMQVGIPVLTVLKEKQLRHYTSNFLRIKTEELFFYQIYLTPTFVCLLMYITLYLIYDFFDM